MRSTLQSGLQVLIAILLWNLLWPSGAGVAVAEAGSFTRSLWRVQDGLPENIVQAIAQDSSGFLWVGTTGGLTRFDGEHFLSYHGNSGGKLPVNSIFCLLAARDGSLWAGMEGGGLLHMNEGQTEVIGPKQGLSDEFVRSIMQDRTGKIWIGTDGGLFVLEDHRAVRVGQLEDTLHAGVHSISEDREGRVWVGGEALFSFSGGHRRNYVLPGSYSENRVKAVLETSDGVHWVGTVSGLLREVGSAFLPVPGIHATVRALRQSSDGVLWIGTIGEGLWMYKDGRAMRVDKSGLLPTSTVLSIFEDRGHNLWIGTQDGLVRLERTPVSLVPLPRDHDSDFGTISRDWDNESWMVANGVYRIHDNVAQPFPFKQLPGVPIRNILRARDGSLWIGTDGSGAYHLSGTTMVHYAAPEQLTNNFVRGFLETTRGEIWIATDEGVSRIGPGTVRKYGMANGLAYFSTRCIIEDRLHDIWIGTDQGLSHIHNDRFVSDAATAALAQEKVWSILQDRGGALWFGTRDHGLFRFKEKKVDQYTTANGLVNDSVYQMLEDREGRLWLSGGDTISSVDIADIGRASERIGKLLSVTSYKMPFAAANVQMYGGRQPAGYVASDDTVWFATSGGAAHVVHQRIDVDRPAVYIESVVADSKPLAAGAGLRLSAQVSRLTFSFAPLLLSSQEGLRFRYKLDGFDKSWTAAGTTRSATYTNLPAGDYRFRVEVLDIANPDLTTEAELTFSKAPHLYQRWWFLACCVLCVAGLVWSIYRFRVQQIQTRFQAVLEERNRLAREMHDTVIQGCTSTSALLEALASLQPAEDAPGSELLGCARIQIRTTIDEARDAVWNLRHDGSAKVDLVAGLHSVAHQAARAFSIAVDCQIAADLPPVAASVGHELLMIVREAFANAGLHAHADQVRLEALMKGANLYISVTDNGIGFSPAEAPGASDGHFGLTGMRERTKRLAGNIQIENAPQVGTQVQLCVRCTTSQH